MPVSVLLISLSAWSFALPRLFEAFGGRLSVYRITSAVGVVASVVAAVACASRSFATLCIASAMFGLPSAAGQTFRFAALSMVPKAAHPKCIGAVLTGGIVGALVGPTYAARSAKVSSQKRAEYAGVYLCTGVALALLLGIVCAPGSRDVPRRARRRGRRPSACVRGGSCADRDETGTSAAVGMATADVGFRCAVAVASLSYGAMSFLMSPTPPVDARARILLRHHRARHHEPHARHVRAQLRDREGGRETRVAPGGGGGRRALRRRRRGIMRDGRSRRALRGGQGL